MEVMAGGGGSEYSDGSGNYIKGNLHNNAFYHIINRSREAETGQSGRRSLVPGELLFESRTRMARAKGKVKIVLLISEVELLQNCADSHLFKI